MGERAEYIKINGNGPNALDFHIAFYIGQIAATDVNAFFHIISKDTGFDPLIAHLKSRKVFAVRSTRICDIPLLRVSDSKNLEEKLSAVVDNLLQRGASRPRTLKTLMSTVDSLFQKQLPPEELNKLITKLQSKGYVTQDGTKVAYHFPATPTP